MSEAIKLAEYLGFEVVYLDGFAYIQEEGTNGPEIKRDATLEERTLWAELEHVSAELAALKVAMGEPVAWTTGVNWHPISHYQSEQVQKLTRKEQPEHGFIIALYAIPKDKP